MGGSAVDLAIDISNGRKPMKLALLLSVSTLLAGSIAAQLDDPVQMALVSAITLGLQIGTIIRLLTLDPP